MKGMVIANEGHVVNVILPVDMTGGATGDRFNMANHQHVSIIISFGATAAAPTSIIVNECDAATAGTATAIPFTYYAEETDGGDTLGAKTTVAATGITSVSANDNIMYVIELDAQELSDGFNYVEVDIACPASAILGSCVAVLSGARYQGAEGATVLV